MRHLSFRDTTPAGNNGLELDRARNISFTAGSGNASPGVDRGFVDRGFPEESREGSAYCAPWRFMQRLVMYIMSNNNRTPENYPRRAMTNFHPMNNGLTFSTNLAQSSRTIGIRSMYGTFGKRPADCAGIDRKSKRNSCVTSNR